MSNHYNNAALIICLFYFIYLFVENIFEVNFFQKQVASVIVLFCALAGVALGMLDRPDGVSEQSRLSMVKWKVTWQTWMGRRHPGRQQGRASA